MSTPSALNQENQQYCLDVQAILERNDISFGVLSRMLNPFLRTSSKTTVHRIVHGNTTDSVIERIRPHLGRALAATLYDRGYPHSEIAEELKPIYQLEEIFMIADRCPLTPEAVRYFGLKHDPFDVDRLPIGEELFTNTEIDAVAGRVRDAILYQRFVAVIGGVGSGKTLLKLRVVEETEEKARLLHPEFFDMSEVTVHGIANKILAELGQKIPQNKEARVSRIKEVLTGMQQEGIRVAIVLDECHRLHDRVISSLKNFWEMTNGRNSRLLGVILFGQPAFVESRLRDVIFREIRQRVQVIQMPELKKSAADYLRHRISFAGGDFDKLFDPKAVDRIAANAATPLALGNLANDALMEAFRLEEKRVDVSFDFFRKLPTGQQVLGMRRSAA